MIPINNVEELLNRLKIIYPTIDDPSLAETLSESDKILSKIIDDDNHCQLQYIEKREDQLNYILQKIQEHNSQNPS